MSIFFGAVASAISAVVAGGVVVVPPAPSAAHRYWRVRFLSARDGVQIGLLRFASVVDGPQIATGGTAYASSVDGTQTAALAFDADTESTFWKPVGGVALDAWLAYDFGTPVEVAQFGIAPHRFATARPVAFVLESSDDNVVWSGNKVFSQVAWTTVPTSWAEMKYTVPADFDTALASSYLRIYSQAGQTNNDLWLSEIVPLPSATSPDSARLSIGGTVVDTANQGAAYTGAKAIDNDVATFWLTYGGAPAALWTLTMAAANVVKALKFVPQSNGNAMKHFAVSVSPDGVNYYLKKEVRNYPNTCPIVNLVAPVVFDNVYGKHRYWGLRMFAPHADTYLGFMELAFYNAVNGDNLATVPAQGFDNGNVGTSETASKLFDGVLTNSKWAILTSNIPAEAGSIVWYDFGAGQEKDIVGFKINAEPVYPIQSPQTMEVVYSDNGTTWVSAWSVYKESWAASEAFIAYTPRIQEPLVTPHRYWSVQLIKTGHTRDFGAKEMELREYAGGPDITAPGAVITSTRNFGTEGPANLIDNNAATVFASERLPQPNYIWYDFGAGVSKIVNEVAFTARDGVDVSQLPMFLRVLWSDDGVTYTEHFTAAALRNSVANSVVPYSAQKGYRGDAHLYWRVKCLTGHSGTYLSFKEIQFRETAAGTILPVTAAAATSSYAGLTPAMAFDGVPPAGGYWGGVAGDVPGAWVSGNVGGRKSVKHVTIHTGQYANENMSSGAIEWSDDRVNWVEAWRNTGLPNAINSSYIMQPPTT